MTEQITAITMPKWGLTMTEGKVLGWLKREGDDFRAGEELLEIETTKITNVFEASEAGNLRRIVAQAGATLPVGGLLAVAAPDSVPDPDIEAFIAGFAAPPPEAAAEAAAALAPRDLEASGRRLRVLEMGAGEGAPILFVHGFGGDLNTWMFNQPALAERHRTLALDLPGHGGATKEVGAGNAASFVAAVGDALIALGLQRVHLVGHSMGGAIALALAAQRPASVASLSVIAGAGLGPEINGAFIDAFVRAGRRREAQAALAMLVHDPALVSRAMVEETLRYKRLDGVAVALAAMAQAWFPDGKQALDLRPALEALTALPVPAQLLWGRDDRIIPIAHAAAWAERLPVHLLDETGHLPHMEKAGEVNRLIAAFVAANP